MKKTTLTIGLFTVVMVLTSFTSPEMTTLTNDNAVINGGIKFSKTSHDGTGGQDTGRTRKLDFNGEGMKLSQIAYTEGDGTGGQDTGRTRKLDFNGGGMKLSQIAYAEGDGTGGQDTGRTRKLD